MTFQYYSAKIPYTSRCKKKPNSMVVRLLYRGMSVYIVVVVIVGFFFSV